METGAADRPDRRLGWAQPQSRTATTFLVGAKTGQSCEAEQATQSGRRLVAVLLSHALGGLFGYTSVNHTFSGSLLSFTTRLI